MTIGFPSREFDDAVAAVCHGVPSEEQLAALNTLLRTDGSARDEYILRLELHSRLASEEDMFVSTAKEEADVLAAAPAMATRRRSLSPRPWWAVGLAAGFALLAIAGWWQRSDSPATSAPAATSQAVAMLDQTVDVRWDSAQENPRLGAPLDPGWLRLEAGLVRVVFYRGARVVIEGPAEFRLISAGEAECRRGRITAEVPLEAQGFRIETPQGIVTDQGGSFGLDVTAHETEVHVFDGKVSWQAAAESSAQVLPAGAGVVVAPAQAPRLIAANWSAFTSLLNAREQLMAAETLRLNRWRSAGDLLNEDPSLRVRFAFEETTSAAWQLRNAAQGATRIADATVIGCQFTQGRWPGKRALAFQSVSDRVRMQVPGEFEAVTLAAWVRVQGLDRQLNSLFMSEGFNPGTLHWLIRHDGVLGLTVVGERAGKFQIVSSPPTLTLDQFGMWVHLAVVVDGPGGRAVHYVNGRPVSETDLLIKPPYRIGTAELGNWNGKGFPRDDPFMIRNFSGAMDEFCLFSRALDRREIRSLYAQGRPEMDAIALRE